MIEGRYGITHTLGVIVDGMSGHGLLTFIPVIESTSHYALLSARLLIIIRAQLNKLLLLVLCLLSTLCLATLPPTAVAIWPIHIVE